MSDDSTSVQALKDACVAFRDDRDWEQYHNPKDLALALTIEAAEMLEIFRFKDLAQVERDLSQDDVRQRLADETADVLYFLLLLSHQAGIDLDEALEHKLEINAAHYPVHLSYGRNLKYTDLPREGQGRESDGPSPV